MSLGRGQAAGSELVDIFQRSVIETSGPHRNVSTSLLLYGGITYLINPFDYPRLEKVVFSFESACKINKVRNFGCHLTSFLSNQRNTEIDTIMILSDKGKK